MNIWIRDGLRDIPADRLAPRKKFKDSLDDILSVPYDKTKVYITLVMSLPNGDRTFFHKKGANAELSPDDINIDSIDCDIFHIGYIFLLDKFDEIDSEYGTVMARLLKSV